MSRIAVPSQAQVEMLLNILEERLWLATGHARTLHARDRTRAAWQEIAVKLNSDGSGCIKNWQQWAKYWKDKKAAAKKKASLMQMARHRTGGGAADRMFFSAVEEKIIAIMGGEGFAIGDRDLEINSFHPSNEPAISDAIPEICVQLTTPDFSEVVNSTAGSESILQGHMQSLVVEPSTAAQLHTEQSTLTIPDLQPSPTWHRENMSMENQPNAEQLVGARSPPSAAAVSYRSNAPIGSSSPRRRRVLTARRRLLNAHHLHKGGHRWRA